MSERPLITFALLCFNQEHFVAEAVRSALAQDYSPLEILISDDVSTDRTWEIVEREVANYAGPHRIRLHRNDANLSCTVHTLAALAMASADLVVVGAGDDVSEPQRVSAIAAVARAQPQAMSFWSDMRLIDEHGGDLGVIPGYRERSTATAEMADRGAAPVGASQAYRKKIGSFFGPVDRRAASEDLVLHFRGALLGGVAKAPGVLLRWRRHIGSMETINHLSDVDASTFRRKTMRVMEQRLFCYRARIDDLNELMRKCPERSEEARRYLAPTQALVARFEATLRLADGNLFQAATAMASGLRNGARPAEVAKNFLMLRFPGLWQRYVRYRARHAGRRAASEIA